MAGLFASQGMAGDMGKIELREGITLQAPSGAGLKEGSGIDSQVGKIMGPDFECQFDIGLSANDLTRIEGATLIETRIAGRRARLMKKGADMDAVHVTQVNKTLLGEVTLTMFCKSATETARKDVRAMFKTLHIK